jgi:hypothetical protein
MPGASPHKIGPLLGLLLGLLPIHAAGQTPAVPVALLPADAPRDLAVVVDTALDRLAAGHAGALGPAALAARLREGLAVEQLRGLVEASDRACVQMDRETAVTRANEAITRLQIRHGRLADPVLTARAWAALALARLLQPRDEAGAVRAFRRALEADPSYRVSPDRLSPSISRLFARAQVDWRSPRSPAQHELRELALAIDARRLVWVAVRPQTYADEGVLALELVLVNRQAKVQVRRRREGIPREALADQAAALVREALGGPPAPKPPPPKPVALPPPPPPPPSPGPARPVDRPWYRKWWVWTIAGAVLVTVGVGVAVVVAGERR